MRRRRRRRTAEEEYSSSSIYDVARGTVLGIQQYVYIDYTIHVYTYILHAGNFPQDSTST